MKIRHVLLPAALSLLAIVATAYLKPAVPVAAGPWWLSNYQEALKESKITGKPILLEFR
jgi:hypothetical protein